MSETTICAGAVEYSQGKRLDGTTCTYVRLRLLVDGDRLWIEDAEALVAECLATNEISVHELSIVDGTHVARINCAETALSDFEEWDGAHSGGLRLRTFLNVLGTDGKSLFAKDDCWDSIILEGRPINYWYEKLTAIRV